MERRGVLVKERPGVEDGIWQQGHEGEEAFAGFLAQRLTDEWVPLKAYRNARGEIEPDPGRAGRGFRNGVKKPQGYHLL